MSNGILLVLSFALSFVITVAAGYFVLRWLRKLKVRQSILEDAPDTHKAKEGTPTMGGIMFLIGIVAACLVMSLAVFHSVSADMAVLILSLLLCALIGFCDDSVKVIVKRNKGLTAKQKLLFQIVVAVAIAFYQARLSDYGTKIYVPIAGTYFDLGWFYIPFVAFVIVAMTNAVNLADGVDGLAGGCSGILAVFLALTAIKFGNSDAMLFTAAVAGGCAGFLVYNHFPAKVFMGDTGSLALGGALASAAVIMHIELILVIAGFVFVIEVLSVMIQVSVFKITKKIYHLDEGKRVFRKTPRSHIGSDLSLHHHFEEGGWSGKKPGGWKETKVDALFWGTTVVFCLIAWFVM